MARSFGQTSLSGCIAPSLAALLTAGAFTILTSGSGANSIWQAIATKPSLSDTVSQLTPSEARFSIVVLSHATDGTPSLRSGPMSELPQKQPTAEQPNSQESAQKTSVANDESKRWRGGRGEPQRMLERAQTCYAYILEGGTRHQITTRLAERYSVSQRTAHDDYKRAMELLKTEQQATREELLNQIQALRLATVTKALRKGQLQTVAMLLKDMGAVIGEAAPETLSLSVPQLNINIED